jgi:hypothetical protein
MLPRRGSAASFCGQKNLLNISALSLLLPGCQ